MRGLMRAAVRLLASASRALAHGYDKSLHGWRAPLGPAASWEAPAAVVGRGHITGVELLRRSVHGVVGSPEDGFLAHGSCAQTSGGSIKIANREPRMAQIRGQVIALAHTAGGIDESCLAGHLTGRRTLARPPRPAGRR